MHLFHNLDIQSPYSFGLLLAIPLLWYLVQQFQAFRQKNLRLFGRDEMIAEQLQSTGIVPRRFWMFLLGIGLLAIAATNPRIQGKPIHITKKGGDVIFALDVSRSMLAQDVKPSRLERAKLVCLNLLQGFDNQRVAVVVFAGDAYVTMPFSTNYSAVANFIDEANPNQVSAQGSDYENLISTLEEYFGKDPQAERGVVVLSDGEDHSDLSPAEVKKANEGGLIFFTVGIGSTKGAPIPTRRGYLQDKSGKKVISKLHKKSLQTLAGKHGKYFTVSQEGALLSAIRHLREQNFSDLTSYAYQSLFQYFLFPGLLFILFSFFAARPKSQQAITVFLLFFSVFAQAQSAHQQFLEGDRAFKKEEYDVAAQKYKEALQNDDSNVQALYNLGVAEAKANHKKQALQYFAQAAEQADNQQDRASALYNAGTLLLSEKGQLDQSIQLLKEALRNSRNDDDIRKNLARAIQLKRQQQKKNQQQQKKNQQKKDQQNKDKQNKDQQNKDQQNKDQQNKDKQNKDQQNKDQQNKDQQNKDKQNKDQQDKDKQDQQNQQPKDQQNSDQNQKNQNHQKQPINIKKQKALQKLKAVEEAERKVRRKMQRMKGKNSARKGKNW